MKLINLAVVAIFAATLVGLQDVNASKTINYLNPVRSAQEDEVKYLPCFTNQSAIKFKHYSGYLKAFEDGEQEQWLHYWFVESESNPATDPVLLWLNGGPGGSSLGKMFDKTGPFRFDAAAGNIFADNELSWNKLANMLYLDGPVGVGFSYSKNQLNFISDNTTAKSNYLALQNFMHKFPEFANNSLYLSGVSYAGTYLPTLGTLIDRDSEFNFKGVAIENGLFDMNKQSISRILFAYYHGLIGKTTWMRFSDVCCHGKPPTREVCDDSQPECISFGNRLLILGIDRQNILFHNTGQLARGKDIGESTIWTDKMAPTASESNQHSKKSPCSNQDLIEYLNDKMVRESIHIPVQLHKWADFSKEVNTKYNIYYPNITGGLAPQFRSLIESPRNLTMLVYNGDLDMVCDFIGSSWFMEDLGIKAIGDYWPWWHGGKVAGFVQEFDGITFATVRGAGHAASSDKPREGFAIIKRFLNARGRNVWLKFDE